jgi:signal transduction histidine kinase
MNAIDAAIPLAVGRLDSEGRLVDAEPLLARAQPARRRRAWRAARGAAGRGAGAAGAAARHRDLAQRDRGRWRGRSRAVGARRARGWAGCGSKSAAGGSARRGARRRATRARRRFLPFGRRLAVGDRRVAAHHLPLDRGRGALRLRFERDARAAADPAVRAGAGRGGNLPILERGDGTGAVRRAESGIARHRADGAAGRDAAHRSGRALRRLHRRGAHARRGAARARCSDTPVPAPAAPFGGFPRFVQPAARSRAARAAGKIIANADSISAETDGPLKPDYAEYASDIANAGRHLLGLVEDLVDLQAIERDDFAPLRADRPGRCRAACGGAARGARQRRPKCGSTSPRWTKRCRSPANSAARCR